jgi:hypothetical protein
MVERRESSSYLPTPSPDPPTQYLDIQNKKDTKADRSSEKTQYIYSNIEYQYIDSDQTDSQQGSKEQPIELESESETEQISEIPKKAKFIPILQMDMTIRSESTIKVGSEPMPITKPLLKRNRNRN